MSQSADRRREFAFSDDDFNRIAQLVRERTGITLSAHKRDMVYGRLARRLRELGFSAFREYCDFLADTANDAEMGNFVNAVTTNLTGFFRESHHFEHFQEYVAELKKGSSKRMRFWSSAASSGQEAYSMAITLKEAMGTTPLSGWNIKILATDIDTNMLETGRNGVYTDDKIQKIPSGLQRKYATPLTRERKQWEMDNSLKELIAFKQLNLLEHWPMKGKFDAIFCRNVVIYFDKPTQKTLFNRMADILNPNGILYIGHSESLYGISERFELIGRTAYKKVG